MLHGVTIFASASMGLPSFHLHPWGCHFCICIHGIAFFASESMGLPSFYQHPWDCPCSIAHPWDHHLSICIHRIANFWLTFIPSPFLAICESSYFLNHRPTWHAQTLNSCGRFIRMDIEAIGSVRKRNRLRWFGHVERKEKED